MPYRIPGEGEFVASTPISPDDYRVIIESYEIEKKVHPLYNKNGDERVTFKLDIQGVAGDDEAAVVDTDGNEVDPERRLVFFFNPFSMGLQPVIAKSRQFFAAAMNVPIEQAVEFDSIEAMCKGLVGKELIVTVITKTNEKGNKVNNITGAKPIRVRTRRQRAEPSPLATAAAEAFPDAVVTNVPSDNEDDLPF